MCFEMSVRKLSPIKLKMVSRCIMKKHFTKRPTQVQGIRILVIYRPPGRSSYDLLYEEFSKLIEQTAVPPGGSLIVGDFNLHVDDGDNFQARRFMDILESYNLRQHVTGATHISSQ